MFPYPYPEPIPYPTPVNTVIELSKFWANSETAWVIGITIVIIVIAVSVILMRKHFISEV
jgi:hypothetical protein